MKSSRTLNKTSGSYPCGPIPDRPRPRVTIGENARQSRSASIFDSTSSSPIRSAASRKNKSMKTTPKTSAPEYQKTKPAGIPELRRGLFYSIGAMRRSHPDWFREDLAHLFRMLAEGRIDPVVAEVLPLAEARCAHERVEAGEVAGKLVLRVSEQ